MHPPSAQEPRLYSAPEFAGRHDSNDASLPLVKGPPHMPRRTALVAAALVTAGILALAGCTGEPAESPSATTGTPDPTASLATSAASFDANVR